LESEWFEWDDRKAKVNFRKHRVGFQDAATVLEGDHVLMQPDTGHEEGEPRWIGTGFSNKGRVL
jgi:uncharacterized DUF497 family protein